MTPCCVLSPEEGNAKPVFANCGVKKKRKTGIVSKISVLNKKGVGSGMCVNATGLCIYHFSLSENVVMCYILLNVMFK
jgi:hypothetical protein